MPQTGSMAWISVGFIALAWEGGIPAAYAILIPTVLWAVGRRSWKTIIREMHGDGLRRPSYE